MKNKKEVIKIISAFVISDAHLTTINTEKCKSAFQLSQTYLHKDLLDIADKTIQNFTSTSFRTRVYDKETHKDAVVLSSRRHPIFTTLRKRFYIEGKKVVDKQAMTLLDGEFLAIWYMCDGVYYNNKENKSKSVTFCTEAFSYGDHLFMQKSLYDKCNLNFRIHKRKDSFRLYLPVKEYYKFVTLITPFMCKSFVYKIPDIEPVLIAPSIRDDDIVCTIRKRVESYRNDKTLLNEE